MQIKKIRQLALPDQVAVTLDNGTVFYCQWPGCMTWHRRHIQRWLDAGGKIDPFQAPKKAAKKTSRKRTKKSA